MKKKCRTCILEKEEGGVDTKHKLISDNYHCPLCNKNTKWYSHINDVYAGDVLECKSCHNYIIYIIPECGGVEGSVIACTWKDEIYLQKNSKEIVIMRYYENNGYNDVKNKTYINIDDVPFTIIDHILQFSSIDNLSKKIDSIVTFS